MWGITVRQQVVCVYVCGCRGGKTEEENGPTFLNMCLLLIYSATTTVNASALLQKTVAYVKEMYLFVCVVDIFDANRTQSMGFPRIKRAQSNLNTIHVLKQ